MTRAPFIGLDAADRGPVAEAAVAGAMPMPRSP
jgi:hypothetical protein